MTDIILTVMIYLLFIGAILLASLLFLVVLLELFKIPYKIYLFFFTSYGQMVLTRWEESEEDYEFFDKKVNNN